VLAVALALAGPAVASAAQSFAVSSPTGFPAGGDPTYTTTINLDTSAGAPGKVSIQLAPGVLASVSANPSCVQGAPQHTSACQIGTGSAAVLGALPISLTAYLVPPPTSSDLVGIDLVPGAGPVTHVGAQLSQTASGAVATVLHLDLSTLGALASLLTKMTLTVNGTLNGKPFNRMPTNCSPGSSTLTITYASKTETSTASPDFTPTGCSALPFHPTLSGTAIKDAKDDGTAVSTTVTQGADEAASASTTLLLPWPTLAANFSSLGLQNSGTPVGTAKTDTPLLPTPLTGNVYFTGIPTAPTLTLKFPPPAVLTLVGNVDLKNSSVNFPSIPDVPVTSLTVTLFGGPKALLNALCSKPSGTLGGSFTGQNGATAKASFPITISGCKGGGGGPTALTLSKLSFTPTRFSAKAGTTVKFTLSRSAAVSIVITRKLHGRKSGRKCIINGTRGPKCTVIIKAVAHVRGAAGLNTVKLGVSTLAKGRYKVQVFAVSGRKHSKKLTRHITIT
jgi:hypothetical protein